jgi:hypothetical protein
MEIRARMKTAGAAIGTILLAMQAQASFGAGPQPGTESIRFEIMRNGHKIGTHDIEISRSGPETTVNIVTDITVKVLFVTAYRFQHTATERWQNGRLVALDSTTDNNGTRHKVSVEMGPSGLQLNADGKSGHLDRDIVPGSLWNPAVLKRTAMLDSQEGTVLPLSVIDGGLEQLTIKAQPVKAHRYTMKSTFSQDVWYDDQGHLVRAKLVASDGSVIEYQLI